MPLINIADVTRALKTLLDKYINQVILELPSNERTFHITAAAPEKLGDETDTLSIHLYHVEECAHYTNIPGPGNDKPNIATASMALVFHYVLTAHHKLDTDEDYAALRQQEAMGYAIKTFHDVPIIDEKTSVASTWILPDAIRAKENFLQIGRRPVPVDESMQYWTAEEQYGPKMAAYYAVRTIMLEPQPPKKFTGTVLSLGTFIVPSGAPQLASSKSVVGFSLPAEAGGRTQQIESSPARVVPKPPLASDWSWGTLELSGSDLAGKSQSLLLNCSLWSANEITDVDVSLDSDWNVAILNDSITAEVQPTVSHQGWDIDVPPGTYTATARVIFDEKFIHNKVKEVAAVSNAVAFTIGVRITGHEAPDPSDRVRVNIEPTVDLTISDLSGAISVLVDGVPFERVPNIASLVDGTFVVEANAIQFQSTNVCLESGIHPFRLVVNGAESQPFWIEVP